MKQFQILNKLQAREDQLETICIELIEIKDNKTQGQVQGRYYVGHISHWICCLLSYFSSVLVA